MESADNVEAQKGLTFIADRRRRVRVFTTSLYRALTQYKRVQALLFPLVLTACSSEDRILSVGCETPPKGNIAIEMGNLGTTGSSLGLLDTPKFKPGMILQLTAASSEYDRGRGTVVYTLRTSDADFLSPRPEAWFSKVVSANFNIETDDDVLRTLKTLNVDPQKLILANTGAWISNAQRISLREPLRLINFDHIAVTLIHNEVGTTNRYTLVSAVSYGQMGLYYPTPPALANNLIEMSKFYLHIKYTCSIPEPSTSTQSGVMSAPIIFIQIPIKYDPLSGTVITDNTPIDLTSVDFLQESM